MITAWTLFAIYAVGFIITFWVSAARDAKDIYKFRDGYVVATVYSCAWPFVWTLMALLKILWVFGLPFKWFYDRIVKRYEK